MDQLQKQVPTMSRGAMPDWWSKREDAGFLLGVYRHGMVRYDDIKTDPALCFHERFQEAAAAAASGDAGGGDGEADADVYNSGRRRSASRRGKRVQVIEWPQTKVLNQRLKNLLRALDASLRKKRPVLVIGSGSAGGAAGDKRQPDFAKNGGGGGATFQFQQSRDEDDKLRKPVKEWSKREKQGMRPPTFCANTYYVLLTHS
jgi:hypothetical protein